MISMKFEGGADIAKALNDLSARLSKKILMDVLTEAAEPMQKGASAHAPRGDKPPHITANIGISPARTDEQAAVKVGPVKGFAYGTPLEVGTLHMQAQPFMRPAFDENLEKSLSVASAAFWRELAGRGVLRSISAPTDVEAPDGGDVV